MTKISIIIVTYNAMKWAERCFSSLRKSSHPVSVIVVDNGSTDGTQEYIQKNFPEVDIIQSSENLGFGRANNMGIEKAYKEGADFFYLMNQDAWIYSDTVDQLLNVYNTFSQKDKIGILSPMHLDGSEKMLDIFLDKYIAQNFENRFISDIYTGCIKHYYEIKFINAAHWLLPKATIETVGGFNPYFFHYGEDNEYVNRIHFHTKKILLCPNAKAVHDGKQNLQKVDYKKYDNFEIETKIMNPSYSNALQQEKKSLQNSIIKNVVTGNFRAAVELNNKLRKINIGKETLMSYRNILSKQGSSFLNL